MKKILSLLLVLCLLTGLTACGGEPQTATEPAALPEATQAPGETGAPTEAPVETPEETEAPTEAAAYITEALVLVDDENVTFTVEGFVENAYLGTEMHVALENKTDKTVIFSLDGVSVCGVMHDPLWAEEVTPGKKAVSVVYFDTFTLAEQGIGALDEISFRLSVVDNDNWMDEPIVDDHFRVFPTGLTAETVVFPEYRHKNGETVLLDNDKLLFIVEKVDDADDDFYTLNCYIANRTDRDLLLNWDGVSVNGFMADPYWGAAVGAGKQLYTQVRFLASDLAERGIETVTEMEFTLTASDYADLGTDYVVEETITFQPR